MELPIKITRAESLKQKPSADTQLGFGKLFTDHMFVVEYTAGKGWHDARIQPYQPFSIDPASPVLHYAQEVFEGLKAYRTPDGRINLFRPYMNARRMNRSADRLCMPQLDEEFVVKAYKALVAAERDWVPDRPGTSLYIRPTMIADGAFLGVRAAEHYYYYIICSPSGSYYAGGVKPIRIKMEDQYVRAVKGGLGFAKTGGNYAASIKATYDAYDKGFDQVLWLDGRENRYVEEVGAMNMMFVINGVVTTAALEGSILAGVTRDSILQIARDRGYRVEERRISVEELFEAYDKGTLTEAFGTGTAAVITPVGYLEYKGRGITLDMQQMGPVAQEFYDTLTGIQWALAPDPYGWTVDIDA